MFREHVLGTIDFTECPGQDVGLMPPRFYCLGAGPMLCHGLLLLSKPAWFCGEANLFCQVISNSQFSSVAQSCSTLYDPMDCCMPGLPVHHHLLEFAQTHVHRVGDAIQPFCPLSSPSPPAHSFPAPGSFLMSWLFMPGGQSTGASASVLPMNIQGWFPSGLTSLISLSKRLSRVFSSTTIQKHQFFGAQPSLWSNSLICTWLLEKPSLWLYGPLPVKWCLCFLIRCLGLS